MNDNSKQRVWLDPKQRPGLWLMGLAALVMVLFWLLGDRATSALQYDRHAIFRGEYWRLVTGHLVHAGFRHMALNLAGGAIMAALFARTYSLRHWTLILIVSLVAIDLGFLFRDR